TLDSLAHQPRRLHPTAGAAAVESGPAQRFLALRDCRETALERIMRAQCVIDANDCDQHRQRRQQADQVIDGEPERQPLLKPEICDARAHISNFAILTMMKMPLPSIPSAMPTSISPRMSENSGMMYPGEVMKRMTVTTNGNDPRIIVLARASLAIARAFIRIVR